MGKDKNSIYPFSIRDIVSKEQYIKDGIDSINQCYILYTGEAVNLCIRDILINFYGAGWQDGFHDGVK